MLHVINSGGMFAYCSDLVVGGDQQDQVHYLSVAGHQGPVKGILAALLEGKSVCIEIEGGNRFLTKAAENYRLLVKKLPSGSCHGAVFVQSALQNETSDQAPERFLMLSHDPTQNHLLLFRQLQARLTEIPLHQTWAEWLWTLHEEEGWLAPLTTLAGHFQGFMVQLRPQGLHEAISAGLSEGNPELDRCFASA